MLFLAVFLGFLAENLRESNVEKSREKEYVFSMVEDLVHDSMKITEDLPYLETLQNGLDTLVHQCYLSIKGIADHRLMYFTYHHYCRGWKDIKLYDKTLIQLKNSGNMRLINNSIADTLSHIDAAIQFYNDQLQRMLDAQNKAVEKGLDIFDYGEYEKANTNTNGLMNVNDQGFRNLGYDPSLIKNDSLDIKAFISRVGFFRNYVITMISIDKEALPGLQHYIEFLRDSYHLKH